MSLFSRLRLRAPTFDNTGSVARDHLASERTFLAWIRTGLGFVALGMAVERFSRLDLETLIDHYLPDHAKSPQQSVGAQTRESRGHARREEMLVGMLLGTGGGSIIYGVTRYFGNMRQLEMGKFRPSYLGAAGLGVAVSVLAGGVCWGALKRDQRVTEGTPQSDMRLKR